jgi:hypothetical protein
LLFSHFTSNKTLTQSLSGFDPTIHDIVKHLSAFGGLDSGSVAGMIVIDWLFSY